VSVEPALPRGWVWVPTARTNRRVKATVTGLRSQMDQTPSQATTARVASAYRRRQVLGGDR
jgi:hypothetical protein